MRTSYLLVQRLDHISILDIEGGRSVVLCDTLSIIEKPKCLGVFTGSLAERIHDFAQRRVALDLEENLGGGVSHLEVELDGLLLGLASLSLGLTEIGGVFWTS